ncbi:MAG: UDP-glucose 4-epimerase GalE [Lentisphaeria bacterium]
MRVLVTGGAGFIGSHTCVELLNADNEVVVVDNLCNSVSLSLKRVEQITGKNIEFHEIDICDAEALDALFKSAGPFDAVIHFAALKAVGESVEKPLKYYKNNVTGTVVLCEVMAANNCKNMVFSSSATVYGEPETMPIREDFSTPGATNPYGWTKLMMEQIFQDIYKADSSWNIIILRYFNPIGAHESGDIGEDPAGIPDNLLPFVAQVAVGRREKLSVFGGDYPTVDGTGVRDYIHVVDLAVGHLRALEKLESNIGFDVYNLGTGKGYSVLQVVKAFEKACGQPIPYEIKDRRTGDIAECWADPSKSEAELNWKAERDLDKMCEDAWRWQSKNPSGYSEN